MKIKLTKIYAVLFILLFGIGASCQIDKAIDKYETVKDKVSLGDSKRKVLSILIPTQRGLSRKMRKPPEKFLKGNDKIEVYFFRSGRQPDGLTTDDEFTPYVFKNGKLVAIGWTALGGAKSQGQSKPNIHIEQNQIANP